MLLLLDRSSRIWEGLRSRSPSTSILMGRGAWKGEPTGPKATPLLTKAVFIGMVDGAI
jgi:hypothetical protein